ncbi:hypothetical protein HYX58_02550 [Candidatus Dependentiae bacterium]|nr:hypothetical protein [Candidatus Dependentiae bacterium]
MNKFLLITFFSLSVGFGVVPLSAQIAGGSSHAATGQGMRDIPDLPPLSEEELELFSQIFENMDEKTLEALAQIGEEYIKEMEAQGKDPYEIFREPMIPATPPVTIKPAEPKIPAGHPIILMPPAKTKEMRAILQELAAQIERIQRKAESDREFADAVKPWKYHFEDIVYFAHQIEQEKIVNYLFDKDFDALLSSIKELHQTLGMLEPQFYVPEVSIDADKSYGILGVTSRTPFAEIQLAYQNLLREKSPALIKKQLEGKPIDELSVALDINEDQLSAVNKAYQTILTREQSKQTLGSILQAVQKAVYTQELIANAKKLLQKYEPEALKIKEEEEKRQAAARKEQEEAIKRRPPLAPRVFEPAFGRAGGDLGYTPTGSNYPSYPSFPSSGINAGPGKGGDAASASKPDKPGDKKKDDKKKDDKKKDDKKKDDKKDEKKAGPEKRVKVPEAASEPVKKKLEKILEQLESFSDYLTKKSITRGGGIAPVANVSPKDLFKDLEGFLTGPVASPYDPSTPLFVRAKDMISALTEMTEAVHKIKKEVRNTTDLSRLEKRELKKQAQSLFQDYEKLIMQEIPELLRIKITPDFKIIPAAGGAPKDISKEMKYLLFGINDRLDTTLSPQDFAVLTQLNPPIIPADNGTPSQQASYMGQFMDAYQEMLKELKPEPLALGAPVLAS